MGSMNLKRLDEALVGFMQNKGLTIIRNVQQAAEGYFQQLVQTQDVGFNPVTEETVSVQESFLVDLTGLAREIDVRWDTGRLDHNQLTSLLTQEGVWLLSFLDEAGNTIFKNRPIPYSILSFASSVARGHEEFRIKVFPQLENMGRFGLVVLRRDSGQGTIIMGLDEEGFHSRSLTFSIERAFEDVAEGLELSYVLMTDERGRIVAQSGRLPESRKEEVPKESLPTVTASVTARKISSDGQDLLEIEAPVVISKFMGTIRLGLEANAEREILRKNRRAIFVSVASMVFITLLSMWLLHKNQTKHLSSIKQMERRVHQAERLSALGRLAAGVAHEIRNPLNAISMAIQRLQAGKADQLTDVIRGEIRRLNDIIEEFLSISRTRGLELRRHDLRGLLDQIVLLVRDEAESKRVKIKTRWHESPLMVSMDLDKMKQAVFNIIKNGLESISHEGTVTVSLKRKGKDSVSLKVSDTGSGLSPDEIEHIFDLDYTTKDKGLGLGLALAHEIIQGHGGEIRVTSRPAEGTTFEILLPFENR
jgi:signal transduction histidine kinase